MPTLSGPGVHGKIIKIRPYEDEGNDTLLPLTDRMRGILLAMTEYLDWKTRWETFPSPLDNDEDRINYVSELKNRLMIMIDICERVTDCITNDGDTRNALTILFNLLSGTPGTLPAGENLPVEKLTENLVEGSNPTCDFDILFAQCRAVIQNTNLAVIDVLEKVEVVTNAVEFAKATWDSVPIVGATDDVVGASGIEELFNYYQEAITEEYFAEYTVTAGGFEDQLAYFLFCKCRGDCKITIDRIWEYYNERIQIYLSPPSFEGFINVLEFMFGVEQDTPYVVDLTHFVAWSLVKYGNLFFGQRFDGFLNLILKLTADEPSNDWIALEGVFGECPEEWQHDWNFTTLPDTDIWTVNVGTFVEGVGIVSEASGGTNCASDISITPTWELAELTYGKIAASSLTPDSGAFRGMYYLVESVYDDVGGSESGNYDLIINPTSESQPVQVSVQVSNTNSAPSDSNVIRSVRLKGTGINPFL